MVWVLFDLRERAMGLTRYPVSLRQLSTSSLVFSETLVSPLITRETVAVETPAFRAISLIVTPCVRFMVR